MCAILQLVSAPFRSKTGKKVSNILACIPAAGGNALNCLTPESDSSYSAKLPFDKHMANTLGMPGFHLRSIRVVSEIIVKNSNINYIDKNMLLLQVHICAFVYQYLL